jgi:hypothetical protein
MSLHEEFLDTARALVRRNQNRPTQGDLRRSISTAYYALFHQLVADAAAQLAPLADQQDVLARAFAHTEMKKGCQLFLKSPVPSQALKLIGAVVPMELKSVEGTFVSLQELRHDADYNRGRETPFTKSDALDAIGRVEAAFRDWARVRGTPLAHVFLSLLLLGERWNRGG